MIPRGRGFDPDGKGRSASSGRIPRKRGVLGTNAGGRAVGVALEAGL